VYAYVVFVTLSGQTELGSALSVITPDTNNNFLWPETMESTLDESTSWLQWLHRLGLHFDPFDTLNAADDPHLGEYLIEHEIFARLWGNDWAWVFAPPGGGKTALRCRISQTCWIGQETNRPFPIPYLPPFLSWSNVAPSLEDHFGALAQAAAKVLLLTLAYRPHWTFRLPQSALPEIHKALAWSLPGPLQNYLDLCQQTRDLEQLRRALDLDHAFALPNPPEVDVLLEWCTIWTALPSPTTRPQAQERWEALLRVLLEVLDFDGGVYLLVDGLDAAPETVTLPEAVAEVLAPILAAVAPWAQQHIYVKGFLPAESQPLLTTRYPELFSTPHTNTIQWTVPLLAQVVRRRIFVATQGDFDSLDAIASPALRGLEAWLAAAALPLPREMLVLTRRVLQEHFKRKDYNSPLQETDVQNALRWYRAARPNIIQVDNQL